MGYKKYIIGILLGMSVFSYGMEEVKNIKDTENDEIFFEIVDEKYGDEKGKFNYSVGKYAIDEDEYGILSNNIDELSGEYIVSDKVFSLDIEDSFENFNRRIYVFNGELDKNILYPTSVIYGKIVPKPIRVGIKNFYGNFKEIPTFVNSILQLKSEKAANALGRFVVNSTIGIAGINDVATKIGMKKDYETMGDTLGTYGVDSGAYLVIPVLGPSTVRDGFGQIVDTAMEGAVRKEIFEEPVLYDNGVNRTVYNTTRTVVTGLNARSLLSFKYGDFNSPFEYDLVKIIYSNFRKIQIMK